MISKDLHTISAGTGSTVVLVPGWPQTAEAFSDLVPILAEHHRVISIDPPGLGDSPPPDHGYDTASVSKTLDDLLGPDTENGFHLVGHDIGAWIAYAWAAQFPKRVKSLTLLDSALPGLVPPRTFPLPYEANLKLWQFSFNTLPDLPELLTSGKESEFFDWLFQNKAKHPERISRAHRQRYVDCYSRPGAMSRGFAYYRAAAKSGVQNLEFSKKHLQMPVLALGGDAAIGDSLRQSMETLARDVKGGVIADCGHYLMEEQPTVTGHKLVDFFQLASQVSD